MTVVDLDGVYHPAELEGAGLRVRHLVLDPDEFTLSGLVFVNYSEGEEYALMERAFLAPLPRSRGRAVTYESQTTDVG